ncbi:hypothetical protein [Natronoglycomyces albus]|uniref:Uncharacterized protein n=1 Tax=Natronoglycomyces albus TaxID=2811108 RepID=A0A895XPN3_9ACTN|nr:hypothetical protein [Natronoglycomyces albus]QSB05503.1 hypothetical protein JQS30_00730 [Natronoglycomyces albus]
MKFRRPGGATPPKPATTSSSEYAEPGRNWKRVGALAAGWGLVLATGAWVGPGIVESGPGDHSALDDAPTSAVSAADRYLSVSFEREDLSYATDVICNGHEPALSPEALQQLRRDLQGDGAKPTVELRLVQQDDQGSTALVDYQVRVFVEPHTESLDFRLTVLNNTGEYCVADAIELADSNENGSDEPTADASAMATLFLSTALVARDSVSADGMVCPTYDGPSSADMLASLRDWADTEANVNASFRSGDVYSDDDGDVVPVTVTFESSSTSEQFGVEVLVVGDCVQDVRDFPLTDESEADD